MLGALHRLAAESITAEQFVALDELRRGVGEAPTSTGAALAEREETLSTWLDDHGVDREWVIAPALAAAGVDVDWCDRAATVIGDGSGAAGRAGVGGQRASRRPR